MSISYLVQNLESEERDIIYWPSKSTAHSKIRPIIIYNFTLNDILPWVGFPRKQTLRSARMTFSGECSENTVDERGKQSGTKRRAGFDAIQSQGSSCDGPSESSLRPGEYKLWSGSSLWARANPAEKLWSICR